MRINSFKVENSLCEGESYGLARINLNTINKMGLEIGDIIAITNREKTIGARLMPDYEAIDDNTIKLDDIQLKNLEIKDGEEVVIARAELSEARLVKVLPLTKFTDLNKESLLLLQKELTNRALLTGNTLAVYREGKKILFKVTETEPEGLVNINIHTRLIIQNPAYLHQPDFKDRKMTGITFEDIGGLKKEVEKIRELVELPLNYPEAFKRLGVNPPGGILLYGPPGTGKTLIARALASETGVNFYHLSGPEIMRKYYGESEARLRDVFEKAKKNAPSILFLDEIDAIAVKRDEVKGDLEKRVVAQLLALMDGLEDRGEVIVIGATNIPDSLDRALRRPGRFDREISIGIPDKKDREEILSIHCRSMPLDSDANLDELARITHGFVGADLAALCREAALNALKKHLEKSQTTVDFQLDRLFVSQEDFLKSFRELEPSVTRDVAIEIPEVLWTEIGGLKKIKERLLKTVEWKLKYPEFFENSKIKNFRGIMLVGSPGVGKTLLVKALVNKININFISIKGPEIVSKWVGESEKGVRKLFYKARQAAPCILFFDEIDALTPHRGSGNNEVIDRVVSQFLTEMDGIQELDDVLVLAATNRVDLIDQALLRPGRFDLIFELPLPDQHSRLEILKIHCHNLTLQDVDLNLLVSETEGFTGAELAFICRQAAFNALSRIDNEYNDRSCPLDLQDFYLTSDDFRQALHEVRRE